MDIPIDQIRIDLLVLQDLHQRLDRSATDPTTIADVTAWDRALGRIIAAYTARVALDDASTALQAAYAQRQGLSRLREQYQQAILHEHLFYFTQDGSRPITRVDVRALPGRSVRDSELQTLFDDAVDDVPSPLRGRSKILRIKCGGSSVESLYRTPMGLYQRWTAAEETGLYIASCRKQSCPVTQSIMAIWEPRIAAAVEQANAVAV